MRLLNTLKTFKFLLVIFLMAIILPVNANTGPTDSDKTSDKEQTQETPIEEPISNDIDETAGKDTKVVKDEEANITNSSFNYFFYVIYRIKFADIFKLPTRNTKGGDAMLLFNLNSLLDKLISPKI